MRIREDFVIDELDGEHEGGEHEAMTVHIVEGIDCLLHAVDVGEHDDKSSARAVGISDEALDVEAQVERLSTLRVERVVHRGAHRRRR